MHTDSPQQLSDLSLIEHVNNRLFWLIFALFCVSCTTPEPADPPTTTATVAPELLIIGLSVNAEAVQTLVPSVRFVPAENQSLFNDLTSETLSAIMVHHVSDADLWVQPVAVDGIVVVVHPDNPVRNLSLGEVQAIFSGRITNWAEVGGDDGAIRPISRERGAGIRTIFSERVLGAQRVTINAEIRPNPTAVHDAVAADPHAIGYLTLGSLPDNAHVFALQIDSIPPTPSTTADQSYPLTTPLYWVSNSEPTGELRGLLSWLQSEDGQDVLGVRFGRIR